MLKHLKLVNFRNHKELELNFGQVTVITGKNGAGKSNILEAVCLLSSCRSFREDDKRNLINLESDFARVNGDDLEVFLQREPRFLFRAKNRGVSKKQSEFIGTLKSVVFSPETISIISGPPRGRRKFLDVMISQKDHAYLRALINFEKIRLERNSLLERIAGRLAKEGELDFWDSEMAREGEIVGRERLSAVEFLNQRVGSIYETISGRSDKLEIKYIGTSYDDYKTEISRIRSREILAGRTLKGPHRDDFEFDLNRVDMANYASRGEMRSAVLALKIAELQFLTGKETDYPLLLLDDVFSEFDSERRSHLFNLIDEYQTIITTTDREFLSEKLKEKAKIVELT